MKNVGGVWLPDGEKHLVEWMRNRNHLVDGKLTYQYHKLEAALSWVRQWRAAVDVGAHCGLWSMHLARRFERLHAFEPLAEHREIWARNMEGRGGLLYPCALGAAPGTVKLRQNGESTGDTCVVAEGPGEAAEQRTLDEFDLEVDFLKIDCEGYELEVLKGAVDTLERCRPAICVEQKIKRLQKNFGLEGRPAVDFLVRLGAVVRRELSGDFILSWD